MPEADVLAFAHIGDLHLTDAKSRNFFDFLAIVAQIEAECARALDFVVLPGDNADNGLPSQYALAAVALRMLSIPVHVIPGDHDMEQGNLKAFYAYLPAELLPKAVRVGGTRCLFLDISGPGGGGPDFRLGDDQLEWVEHELAVARKANEATVVFMHSYPADLKATGETERLTALFDAHDVALVDMGHTHYNEIANDGKTIYSATRSTGQIEEGPVGYSITTVSNGVVSWRFKPLDDAFPFVIITSPSDYRLLRRAEHAVGTSDTVEVCALVCDRDEAAKVECRAGDGAWQPMERGTRRGSWIGRVALSQDAQIPITVRAMDQEGRPGQHTILAARNRPAVAQGSNTGSDAATIGAWIENGIFGTQLGPNRNGRKSS